MADGMNVYDAIEFGINDESPEGVDPADRLLASVFDPARFDVAVADLREGLIRRARWPQVILSPPGSAGAAVIRKAALKGLSLVVAVKIDSHAFEQLVKPMRYELAGRCVLGEGGHSDPFPAGWNKDELEGLLRVASRLTSRPLVLFGHDADPIWLLTPK